MAFADREAKRAAEAASALNEINPEEFQGANPFEDEAEAEEEEEENEGQDPEDKGEELVEEDGSQRAKKVRNIMTWSLSFDLTTVFDRRLSRPNVMLKRATSSAGTLSCRPPGLSLVTGLSSTSLLLVITSHRRMETLTLRNSRIVYLLR